MNEVEWLVVGGGAGVVALIWIYFFGPKGEGEKAVETGKKQKAEVVVDAAYIPSKLRLKKDVLAEITFDRRDSGECTDWVIFKDLPNLEGKEIKAKLAEGKKTIVSFTPTREGKYDYVCGMGMVHGQLVVSK